MNTKYLYDLMSRSRLKSAQPKVPQSKHKFSCCTYRALPGRVGKDNHGRSSYAFLSASCNQKGAFNAHACIAGLEHDFALPCTTSSLLLPHIAITLLLRYLRLGTTGPSYDTNEYALGMGMKVVPLEAMPVAQ